MQIFPDQKKKKKKLQKAILQTHKMSIHREAKSKHEIKMHNRSILSAALISVISDINLRSSCKR